MASDITMTSTFDPPGIRLGVVRGISYGLFGPPGEFGAQARAWGPGWSGRTCTGGRWSPNPAATSGRRGRPARRSWTAMRRSGPPCAPARRGAPASRPTSCRPPRPRPARVRGVRPRTGAPLRRAGALLAVRQRAEQHRPALGGHRGRVRRTAHDRVPRGQGGRPGRGGGARRLRVRRVQQRARQRAPAVLQPRRGRGPGAFDLFSVHLYGDIASLPDYLATARQFMLAHGYLKPVVVGEHAGPQPFEFPEAIAVMQEVFAAAFAEAPAVQSTDELAARATQETPERKAMTALYERMGDLPPAAADVHGRLPGRAGGQRERITCRQVVMRTVLALAEGVHRTAYWNLAPEYPGPVDHLQMMHLMIGKLPLLGYQAGQLSVRHPAADTFALLARSSLARRPCPAPRLAARRRCARSRPTGPARAPARGLGSPRPVRRRGRAAGHGHLAVDGGQGHRHRRLRPLLGRGGARRPDPVGHLRHPAVRGEVKRVDARASRG